MFEIVQLVSAHFRKPPSVVSNFSRAASFMTQKWDSAGSIEPPLRILLDQRTCQHCYSYLYH